VLGFEVGTWTVEEVAPRRFEARRLVHSRLRMTAVYTVRLLDLNGFTICRWEGCLRMRRRGKAAATPTVHFLLCLRMGVATKAL
jgi:hypothetical protein